MSLNVAWIAGCVCLLIAAGCNRGGTPAGSAGAGGTMGSGSLLPRDPRPEVDTPVPPPGIQVSPGPFFTFDTEMPSLSLAVAGSPAAKFIGRLASVDGRRAIDLETPSGTITVAEVGWHLVPAAATVSNGTVFVCWSTLLGAPTKEDHVPHPASGVALSCAVAGKKPVVLDAPGFVATWLDRVDIAGTGARIVYRRDPTGWPAPTEGRFTRVFDGMSFGPEEELKE